MGQEQYTTNTSKFPGFLVNYFTVNGSATKSKIIEIIDYHSGGLGYLDKIATNAFIDHWIDKGDLILQEKPRNTNSVVKDNYILQLE